MVPTRRRVLQVGGAMAVTALAGCTSSLLGSEAPAPEYALTIDSIDVSPVEHALYEPDGGTLFGDPAQTAHDAILPDGPERLVFGEQATAATPVIVGLLLLASAAMAVYGIIATGRMSSEYPAGRARLSSS